jgi:hypothetical protein
MWRLVREGLRFYHPTLLISWVIGAAIVTLVLALLAVFGSVQERSGLVKIAVQIPLPILIASVIASFIAIGTERGESRVRMQVVLPLRVGEIALARVLLPTALMLFGLALAHALFGVMLAVEGSPALSPRHFTVDFIGVQLLFWLQIALAVREVIDLRHRRSWTGALGPKALLVTAVALMALIHLGPWDSLALRASGAAVLTVLVMGFTVALFFRRSLFTK